MGILYGDLTADQRDVILMGAGTTDWENQEIVDSLRSITPLLRKSRPPGALLVPATWATVTQVAATFDPIPHIPWCPGPDLQRWILAEVMRRMAPVAPLAVPETGRVPMPHQRAGAFAIGMSNRFFLADEAGPQPAGTPVWTPSGWARLGGLRPGDLVFGRDGSPVAVEATRHLGRLPAYRVTLSDGTSTLATGEHRWRVLTGNDRARRRPGGRVLSTLELARAGLRRPGGGARWFLPQQPVIAHGPPASSLPLAPYAYGALLGGGCPSAAGITLACPEADVVARVRAQALAMGAASAAGRRDGRCPAAVFRRDGPLGEALAGLGALAPAPGRRVHGSYLRGGEQVRRELLRGLLDTGGHAGRGGASAEFTSASPQLARDAAFLGRSLGAVVTESGPRPAGHRVLLRFPAAGPAPFWCERKAGAWSRAAASAGRREPPRSVAAIEPAGDAECCCITVAAGDGVYLTGTALVPTRNCGKSGSALLGLAELQARGKDPFPVLVVCPASVVDSWLEEAAAWFPSWAATAYMGPRRTRLSRRYQLYVTSYSTFRNDMRAEGEGTLPPLLRRLQPRALISDEMHAACNSRSGQSRALRQAAPHVPYLIGMSGTPITHGIGGFWAAMHCIDPAAFPSKERYKARYARRGRARDYGSPQDDSEDLDPLRAAEFQRVMTGTMRRVAKADVLADLPPKAYSARVVDIPPRWRAAYEEMEQDMIAHLPDDEDAVLPAPTVLTQLMRLQQLASAACDVSVATEWDEEAGEDREVITVAMREPSWKVDELMAFLAEHDGSPLVTCAPHRQLVELAGRRAQEAGYRTGYIIGGQSRAARSQVRHAFQAGELDLLCVTTDAGGVGLTLTAAYTMVFLERPWAYWQASQMEDRVHRVSQTQKVHIVDIIARDTVEARVREALKRKARSLGQLLADARLVREVLGGLPANPRASQAAA